MHPHAVQAWFQNPFCVHGSKIWLLPCPTHELKSLVAALYSSREGGPKWFVHGGTLFGWKAVIKAYEREVHRASHGRACRVPGLKREYVHRDMWVRLRVVPAKILQQEPFLAELSEYVASVPPPEDGQSTQHVIDYLRALSLIFEFGMLSHSRVDSMDSIVIQNIREGFRHFTDWIDDCKGRGADVHDLHQTVFLAWQTWDLLRLTIEGFLGYAEWFFAAHPGYYIVPVRYNGSAIETLFSQVKQAKGDSSTLTAAKYDSSLNAVQAQRVHRKRSDFGTDYLNDDLSFHNAIRR
jgi:hypothetical protein